MLTGGSGEGALIGLCSVKTGINQVALAGPYAARSSLCQGIEGQLHVLGLPTVFSHAFYDPHQTMDWEAKWFIWIIAAAACRLKPPPDSLSINIFGVVCAPPRSLRHAPPSGFPAVWPGRL